jgi:hypothetical protein
MARQEAGRVGNGTVGEQPDIIQREAQQSLHRLGQIAFCILRGRGHI